MVLAAAVVAAVGVVWFAAPTRLATEFDA